MENAEVYFEYEYEKDYNDNRSTTVTIFCSAGLHPYLLPIQSVIW